jgi:hypothetical protein
MNGKIVGAGLLIAAAIAGAGIWYTQEYAYYRPLPVADTVVMTTVTGTVEEIPVRDFQGTDSDSSPIRYRACFSVESSLAALTETMQIADGATPLIGPRWLDCFDAEAIGRALQSGDAIAFLGQKNVAYGVDRIVAVDRQGHAWAWNQLNNCGETAYDGSPVGEACPERPAPERTE